MVRRLAAIAKSRTSFTLALLLTAYALAGFILAPYLVQWAVPRYAANALQRRASIGKAYINPFTLSFDARDFEFTEADGRPILGFKRLLIDLEIESLFRWAWTFQEIQLAQPTLHLDIDPQARLNFQALADSFPRSTSEPQPATAPPALIVGRLALTAAELTFSDRSRPTPASAKLAPIDLEFRDVSTLPERTGPYDLTARLPGGGSLLWKGEISLQPLRSSGQIKLAGLKPATAWRFFRDLLALAEPAGTMDAQARYNFEYRQGLTQLLVEDVELTAKEIALTGKTQAEPILVLDAVHLGQGRIDVPARAIEFGRLEIGPGRVRVEADRNGKVNWQTLYRPAASPKPAVPSRPASQPLVSSTVASIPWTLSLQSAKVADISVQYRDRSRATPLRGDIGGLGLEFGVSLQTGSSGLGGIVKDASLVLTQVALAEDADHPLLSLGRVRVAEGMFDFATRAARLGTLELGPGHLSVEVDSHGVVDWQMLARPDFPPKSQPAAPPAPWKLDLASVRVSDLALHYGDASKTRPIRMDAGALTAGFALVLESQDGNLSGGIRNGALELSRFAISERNAESALLGLDQAKASGLVIDLGGNTIQVAEIALKGGGTRLVFDRTGRIQTLDVLSPADRGKIRRELPKVQAEAEREGRPWSLALDRLALDEYAVGLEDRSVEPATVLDLFARHLALTGIRTASKTSMGFEARLDVRQGGSLRASGRMNGDFGQADAKLQIDGVSLLPLKSYVSRYTTLELAAGKVSTAGDFNYRQGSSTASVRYAGELHVAGLLLKDVSGRERFLAWQALSAKGLSVGINPDELRINEIRLQRPQVKIVVFKDRSVNLAKVMKAPAATPAPPHPPPKPRGRSRKKPFLATINRVSIEKGEVDFADLSLVLPYAAPIRDFHGVASGISSKPVARTSVQFEGRVGNYGLARVLGSLETFQPKRYSDIEVVFRNVHMPPLSPYSATFAGRRIASGRLDLDLQYKIENGGLAGKNKVLLKNFTLGQRVEAPHAVDLPLNLAIALLKDARGRINLAVPVRGNLNDPRFDYGKVIWQAFVTLIRRTVSAPFRTLAAVFGGSGEALSGIRFDPGSARLLPPEQGKLAKVAEGLKNRQQLHLTVQGRYDEKLDVRALRVERARRAVAARIGLDADEELGPLRFDDADTQLALEALLEAQKGPDALETLAAAHQHATGSAPERVNAVLAWLGKGSADTAFYQALYQRLVELEPVSKDDLEALARKRRDTIVNALAGFGVAPAMIAGAAASSVQATSDGVVESTLSLAPRGGAKL